MKTKNVLLGAGLALSSALFTLTVLWAAGVPAKTSTPVETAAAPDKFPPSAPVLSVISTQSPSPLYHVRLIDGQVRLLTAGDEGDYRILSSIDPRTLRSADIALLTEGISLYSQTELLAFLEDFSI